MPPRRPKTQKAKLKSLGIRHFDDLIHDQPRSWLIKHFSEGADEYPVNVSRLLRNIIWQTRSRVINKTREPLRELVRTFWYMFVKPTLARVSSLSRETDQYNQLVSTLVDMVKDWQVMNYKDIGFRDDNRSNRKVGLNANVILFSEKLGHQDFLEEMADKYQVSILALGGQPSVMNSEYFVDDLKTRGVDIRRSFFLFSIVDYDTSGWIVRDSFMDNLRRYGIKRMKTVDLIHPDILTPEEINLAKFPVPDSDSQSKKNTAWIKSIRKMKFQNQRLLGPFKDRRGKRQIFGLEAEAVSGKRLAEKIDILVPPLLSKSERLLKIVNLEKLDRSIKDLIVHQLT